jgi:hypothetical protein
MVIQYCAKISEILGVNEAQLEEDKPLLNSNDIIYFKYAPVMSEKVSHFTRLH